MNIAFDAKRLFNNVSGLGNYSRTTLNLLSSHYTENKYHLFTPYIDSRIGFTPTRQTHIHEPKGFWKIGALSSVWRSTGFGGELDRNRIDIFHGLSNEIPTGLDDSKIKKVVTIHDLIFLRYPELYNPIDRGIYMRKFKYAAENADIIVSVSEYTKNELIHHYKLPESKIEVVYQTCGESFFQKAASNVKEATRAKYNLPQQYILSVGTIEKRKNVLNLLKAMVAAKTKTPLVVVGQATNYLDEIRAYIEKHKLTSQVIFLHNVKNSDLPAIYQLSIVFVYISIIEGFGIPVLEAMASGVPVITTRGSTMEESGRDAYAYVDPNNIEEIAHALKTVIENNEVRKKMISTGNERLELFAGKTVIHNLHEVYKKLL